jgi:hypothetical protein
MVRASSSGELFRVQADGELKVTRMEFRHFEGYALRTGHFGSPALTSCDQLKVCT